MEMPDRSARYGGFAQSLHWLTVVLFVIAVAIAFVLPEDPRTPIDYAEYSAHKSLGVTIFFVTILRLIWRRIAPPPPLPADVGTWDRVAARTVQYLLYVALIAQPVIGVLMVWSDGSPVVLFGSLPLPTLLPDSEALNAIVDPAHFYVGWSLVLLAALHALAALRHHFILKNAVLRSMLPTG
jgi:cytochrome b561